MIVFVGLSNKQDKEPLDVSTKSGQLINEIDSDAYKTNICRFAPLDENGKLRYPTKEELDLGAISLFKELEKVGASKVFLLGTQVQKAIERLKNVKLEMYKPVEIKGIEFIYVFHPAYIMTYKQGYKEEYVKTILGIIGEKND